MTTLEKQAHKTLDAVSDTKAARDLLRIWKDGHTFYCQDPNHWECKKVDGTTYQIYVGPNKAVCTCPAYGVCAHIHTVWTLQRLMPQLGE